MFSLYDNFKEFLRSRILHGVLYSVCRHADLCHDLCSLGGRLRVRCEVLPRGAAGRGSDPAVPVRGAGEGNHTLCQRACQTNRVSLSIKKR